MSTQEEFDKFDAKCKAYEQRLEDLKTMPYQDYLETPEWYQKRKAHLRSAKYRCQVCNQSGALHVHHRSYDSRPNENWSDLIVLCEECHSLFHENGKLR